MKPEGKLTMAGALVGAVVVLVGLLVFGPPAKADGGVIGYVGCSNTRMSVQGYQLDGGKKFWPAPGAVYNGGTVPRWASGAYNGQLSTLASMGGQPEAIWLEVCLFATESNLNADIAAGVKVILDLQDKFPGVPVYVSGLNPYPDHVCKLTGADGPAKAQKVADFLVEHDLARRGPQMSNLPISDTRGDGCHPNQVGAEQLGQDLLAFFG